jgi:hypothetical protein
MRKLAFIFFVSSLAAVSRIAAADDTRHSNSDPPEPTHWYGYQTLAVDAAAVALSAVGFSRAEGRGRG